MDRPPLVAVKGIAGRAEGGEGEGDEAGDGSDDEGDDESSLDDEEEAVVAAASAAGAVADFFLARFFDFGEADAVCRFPERPFRFEEADLVRCDAARAASVVMRAPREGAEVVVEGTAPEGEAAVTAAGEEKREAMRLRGLQHRTI